MRVPGLKRARQLARWLRSRWTGGALILGYHRVATVARDPYGMCVQKDHFDEQLAVLRELANPISLEQLLTGRASKPLPPRSVVVTFDDGYIDNLHNARPLLAQYGVPATVFVATGYLGGLFWWDELAQLILDAVDPPQELVLQIRGRNRRWQFSDGNGFRDNEQLTIRSELLHRLYSHLLPLDPDSREEILDRLRDRSNLDRLSTANSAEHVMSADDVREMSSSNLVTIGAHTVKHPLLALLRTTEQWRELVQSRQCLEDIIGRPVTTFSYPNGSASDVTRTLVDQAGFTLACASFNDVARPHCDRLFLPRFWVPDWNGETFGRWLHRWLPT